MSKRKIFGIIIIVIGILAISITPIMKWYIKEKMNSSLTDFDKLTAEDLSKNEGSEGDFDFDNIDEISPSKVMLNPGSINKDLIIGQLVIPSIKVNLTLFKGLSNNEMLAGVGTMKQGQVMGQGNFAIAGHYANNSTLLGDLTGIQNGDIIRITDKTKIYEYKVYETKVVSPQSVDLIEDKISEEKGKPVVSIMNCYYKNNVNTGDRFFVFGELVDTKDYNNKDMISKAQ